MSPTWTDEGAGPSTSWSSEASASTSWSSEASTSTAWANEAALGSTFTFCDVFSAIGGMTFCSFFERYSGQTWCEIFSSRDFNWLPETVTATIWTSE